MKLALSFFLVFNLSFLSVSLWGEDSPKGNLVRAVDLLKPVKTDSPRATMESFILAMNDYRLAVQSNKAQGKSRIDDAIRLFDLEDITHSDKEKLAKDAAIFLKETIDRVIVIDLDLIPDDKIIEEKSLDRWRLKDTEIKIRLVKSGEREGEWLFSKDTVLRAKGFYNRLKKLPYLKNSGMGAAYEKPWFEREIPDWWRKKAFVLPNWQFVGLFLAIFLGLLVKKVTTYFVDRLKRFTSKTKNSWDDQLINATEVTFGSIAASLFWLLGIRMMNFEGNAFLLLDIFLKVMLSYYLIKLVYELVDVFSDFLKLKAESTEFPLDDQLVPLIRKSLRIFTIVFGGLVAVQNLGVNVMSVLAGLGLGGLAFALAARDACANLFGSIMILTDKPFRVGDWISVDGLDGTVEEIGFRSTKIRSFYGSQISVPNSKLANENIDNMGRRQHRRVKATLGLTYSTPPEKMEAFLEGVKNIILANPHTVKDNFHVVFHSYGDFSLNVLVYVFLDVKDWAMEMVERQNLYLEIMRLSKEIGVEFAFPTQSIFLTNEEAQAASDVNEEALKKLASEFGPQGPKSKSQGLGIFKPLYKN